MTLGHTDTLTDTQPVYILPSAGSKKYYDRKVRAVEIVKGDQVLVKNVRERGGTGRLRSFWEETLFVVTEKRENVPVYTI